MGLIPTERESVRLEGISTWAVKWPGRSLYRGEVSDENCSLLCRFGQDALVEEEPVETSLETYKAKQTRPDWTIQDAEPTNTCLYCDALQFVSTTRQRSMQQKHV